MDDWPEGFIDKVVCGDAIEVMNGLPAGVVQCCVTSPPYWGLRDYQIDNQIGLESTPEEYVSKMVQVFREVKRVLRDDGTVWLNLGDTYAGSWGAMSHDLNGKAKRSGNNERPIQSFIRSKRLPRKSNRRDKAEVIPGRWGGGNMPAVNGLKPKDLCLMPFRVASALQADGWWLRSVIIWHKPSCMPESCTDRPTTAHEYVFLLANSQSYYYDADAIREPVTGNAHPRGQGITPKSAGIDRGSGIKANRDFHSRVNELVSVRNKRTVWTINPEPTPYAHFATFPEKLVEPPILAGSKQGDIILDPFSGSGTVGVVAKRLLRKYILIDLNSEYNEIAEQRLAQNELELKQP